MNIGRIMGKSICEIWKTVEGFPNYEVSSLARVRNKTSSKILKFTISNGYYYVQLSRRKRVRVNRLVALHFVPNPDNLPVVRHDDHDKSNNLPTNLIWQTQKQNINHGTTIARRVKTVSKPVIQLDMLGNFVKRWDSINDAGRNGFLTSKICLCCKGFRTHHKNFIWRYE